MRPIWNEMRTDDNPKIWLIDQENSLEITGNYSMRANYKRDFQKMDIFGISKSIFSYKF